MRKVFFAGSFNPFTKGHADILKRLLALFDRVTVGIGCNIEKPDSTDRASENASRIEDWVRGEGLSDRVDVVTYAGLTAEEARRHGCLCLARGARPADFEYEWSLAALNRDAFGIDTLILPADPSAAFVSSSAIRDLKAHGRGDLAKKYEI